MRVISGAARGRPLKSVPGMNTRPTTDKVKEAIFSMIGPYFDGGAVLDLFAGTGALGIEALSRGAEQAVFIDIERSSIETVKANLQAAGFTDRSEVFRNDASQAIKQLHRRQLRFHYIFLDPPYRMTNMDELLIKMLDLELIDDDAVVVIEYDSANTYPEAIGALRCQRKAAYGETAVSIYRKGEA